MTRYRQLGENDDAVSQVGDAAWFGFESRSNPAALVQGKGAASVNMRMDRGTVRPRKGAVVLGLGVQLELSNPPLVLPFDFPADGSGVQIFENYEDGSRTSGVWRGEAYPLEELEMVVNGAVQDVTVVYRGREVLLHSTEPEDVLRLQDWLVLVFSDAIYLYDTEEEIVVRRFALPLDEPVPDTQAISVLQAADQLFVWRGKTSNEWLRPLVWNGRPDASFVAAPDAVALSNVPRASYGVYASNQVIVPLEYTSIPVDSLTYDDGTDLATVTTVVSHGLRQGDRVTVANADLAVLNGDVVVSSVPTATTFTYAVDVDSAGTDVSTTVEVQVATRDEFVISGELEPFEYDLVNAHFRPNKGSADWLVGFVPFQRDRLLVLMRKSVHVLNGLNNPAEATLELVTEEVGCIGRRTAVVIGQDVFFLSDQGVYSLRIVDELNVRGAGEPLSKDVNDYMERINTAAAASLARAVYVNNRYYLAVPIDGAARNNAVLVYNILNGAWESVDVYPESLFFDELVVAEKGGRMRVFGMAREGSVVLLEEREDGDEVGTLNSSAFGVVPVPAQFTTRRYLAEDSGIKRWLRASVDVRHGAGDRYAVSTLLTNPDGATAARVYAPTVDDDTMHRLPVRMRGFGAQLVFSSSAGRPELRLATLDAIRTDGENRRFQ